MTEIDKGSVSMLQMKIIKKFKTSYQIKFSNDYRFLCHTMGSKTIIYDTNSWEKIKELSKPNHPGFIHFSDNDEYLYIKNTSGTLYLYETVGFELIKTIKSNKKYQLVEADFALTNTSLVILDTLNTKDGNQLALINMENGDIRVLTQFKDSINYAYYNQFIEAERAYLFTLVYEITDKYNDEYIVRKIVKVKEPLNNEAIEVIENSEIWDWNFILFNSIHNSFIVVERYDIIMLDAQFNEIIKRVKLSDKVSPELGVFHYIHLSNDGQFIILTYSKRVIILRYEDLEPIVVEEIQYACFGEFSSDDRFILIGTWNNGYILENTLC